MKKIFSCILLLFITMTLLLPAYAAFDKAEIGKYQSAFIFYSKVRRSVKRRYADSLDNTAYEKQMQNLQAFWGSISPRQTLNNPLQVSGILDRIIKMYILKI